MHRTQSRSPTGGICGTTWCRQWRRPSFAIVLGYANPNLRRTLQTIPSNSQTRPLRPRWWRSCRRTLVWSCAPASATSAVQELLCQGKSLSAICRILTLDRKTVQRFARATDVEQLLVRARSRGSLVDRFKPYLHERFNAGVTDAAALTVEIQQQGYRGSDQTVRRYLRCHRFSGQGIQ